MMEGPPGVGPRDPALIRGLQAVSRRMGVTSDTPTRDCVGCVHRACAAVSRHTKGGVKRNQGGAVFCAVFCVRLLVVSKEAHVAHGRTEFKV